MKTADIKVGDYLAYSTVRRMGWLWKPDKARVTSIGVGGKVQVVFEHLQGGNLVISKPTLVQSRFLLGAYEDVMTEHQKRNDAEQAKRLLERERRERINALVQESQPTLAMLNLGRVTADWDGRITLAMSESQLTELVSLLKKAVY